MKILLFGASGRLGSAIQRVLPHHEYLTPRGHDLDLTNADAVRTFIGTHPVDVIINCAAYNDTAGAETDPERADALNGTAPGTIAAASGTHNIPFIHFSTDYVFDGTRQEGYIETNEPHPESAYARSKRMGEVEALKNNPKSYVIRTSRLYGLPGSGESKKSFVEIVVGIAKEKPTFDINAAEISAPTLVDDIARHLEKYILSFPEPGIYHIANEGGCSWYEWAKAIVEILKLPVVVTPRDPVLNIQAIKKPAYSILRSTKIPSMRPWREALEDFLLNSYGRT